MPFGKQIVAEFYKTESRLLAAMKLSSAREITNGLSDNMSTCPGVTSTNHCQSNRYTAKKINSLLVNVDIPINTKRLKDYLVSI